MNKFNTLLLCAILGSFFFANPLVAQYFFKQYESPELSGYCSTSIEKTSNGYRMYAERTEANNRFYLQLDVDVNGNQTNRQITPFDISQDRYLRLQDGNFIRFKKQSNGAQAQKIRPNGQVLWTRNLSDNNIKNTSENIVENKDGKLLLGYYDNRTPSRVHTYRLNGSNGTVEWTNQIDAPGGSSLSTRRATNLRMLLPTNDGGVIFSLFVDSQYLYDDYTFRVNGSGAQVNNGNEDFYFGSSEGFSFVAGKNANVFKFNGTGAQTPKSSSYLQDSRYKWFPRYNPNEYQSGYSGQGINLTAATSAADGGWFLAGFKREYGNSATLFNGDNSLGEGIYRQEMHLAKLDALGNEIFVNVNYPVVGLIKNISELPDGKIMLSGIRDAKPWMLLVSSKGIPNDASCTENINGFSFKGDLRGHHYFLSNAKGSYTAAQQSAQAAGGYLAAVEDVFEHNRLYSVVRAINTNVFIGLNDLQSEGNPRWDNGQTLSYQNFQPNTQNTADNDLVSIVPWSSQWVWENRFTERQYFLEIDCENENEPILADLPSDLGFTGCIGESSSNYFEYDRIAEASSTAVETGFNTSYWWKAVDGDRNSYFQTKAEEQASWSTRFGGRQVWIEEIRIYPRANGQFPLENIILELDNISSETSIPVQATGTSPIVIPVGRLARSVRLQKQNFGVLSFAEIEIEACLGDALYQKMEGYFSFDVGTEFVCPDDVTLQAGSNGKATFNLDNYAFQLDCLGSGNGGSRREGPQDGEALLPGEYLYEIRSSNDVCGAQYCNFKITVLPFQSNNGEITRTSCQNVMVQTTGGQAGAIVNWNLPTATTTCSVGNAININQETGQASGSYFEVGTYTITYLLSDACNNTTTCTFQVTVETASNADCPDLVNGFDLLGEFGGSKYYISTGGNSFVRWTDAKVRAAANGGYLASISSAAENNFLLSKLQNRIVHIGYSKINGVATWDSGEAVTYTNLASNSANTGYAQMNFWAGTWNLQSAFQGKQFVMEIPCGGNTGGLLPDLTISNIKNLATSAASGEIVRFNFDLNNSGQKEVEGNYSIKIYLSSNNTFDDNDKDVGEIITGNTPIGTIANVQAAINLSNVAAGNYFLLVVADRLGQIAESNENNNVASATLSVTTSSCPTNLAGFRSLGKFNGSAYFLSDANARPNDAQTTATSKGGHLASIGSKAENDFLQSKISGLVYIGLNDVSNEGTLRWASGENVGYQNFNICSFCKPNTQDNDYVVMANWDGTWSYSGRFNERKYIVEIPCSNNLSGEDTNQILTSSTTATSAILKLSPNPASDVIMAKVQNSLAQDTHLMIYDINGKMVLEQAITLTEGYNEIAVPIQHLPSGVYVLRLQNSRKPIRFVKVE